MFLIIGRPIRSSGSWTHWCPTTGIRPALRHSSCGAPACGSPRCSSWNGANLITRGIRRRCSSGSRRAGALGCRGRRLVMIVIPDPDDPDPDDPGVDLPPLGVEALTPVAVIRSAEVFPGPDLVHLAQPPDRGVQRFRILHLQSVGAHRQYANTYVHFYGRAGLSPAGPAGRPRRRSWRTTCQRCSRPPLAQDSLVRFRPAGLFEHRAVMPHPALPGAEISLPESPHPEGAATGPAGDDPPHIVMPCNARPELTDQDLLSRCVVGSGSWPLWNCPLPWRKLLAPAKEVRVEGGGHDSRGARAAVSAGVGRSDAGPARGVGHGPSPRGGERISP